MKRQDKYPETDTFHYHNANPHHRFGGDCVVRAISTASGKSWEQVVRELTEVGIKYGLVLNDTACYEKYLDRTGWTKHPQPRKADNTKYTGQEFCRWLSANKSKRDGNIIAHIGGHHIVAIAPICSGDGTNDRFKVLDIWNSTGGCIGNYWTKA